MTPPRPTLLLRLGWRDLVHRWPVAICLVVSVAAALIPLLVLFGLRYGIVTNMIDDLRSDPRINEIRLTHDLELDEGFFDNLRADPRVGFVLPRARYLAASVRLRGEDSQSILEPRMIPTAEGDPLTAGLPVPAGFDQILVTERVAIATQAEVGARLELIVMRRVGEAQQSIRQDVGVIGILPRDVLQTDDILVDPLLEAAIERWREGFAVPELGWEGVRADAAQDAGARSYASFRLYAGDIRDVPGLRDSLLAQGLRVETNAAQIETILAIEAGLGWVFIAVSVLTAAGFVLTLGLHLFAQVIDKLREISLLRLLGMGSVELALFPSLQGMILAGCGAVLAIGSTLLLQPLVNRLLDGLGGLEGDVSRLEPSHLLVAAGVTILAGGAAGIVAGFRIAATEPTKGLRYD